MNNTNEFFAMGNDETPIPANFVQAIEEYNAESATGRYRMQRSCRSLLIDPDNYEAFFGLTSTGGDRCCSVYAPGGGSCGWFLCRYQGRLYFVFSFICDSSCSARSTDQQEIDELTGRIQPIEMLLSYDGMSFDGLEGDVYAGFGCDSTEPQTMALSDEVGGGGGAYHSDPFTTPPRAQGQRLFPETPLEAYVIPDGISFAANSDYNQDDRREEDEGQDENQDEEDADENQDEEDADENQDEEDDEEDDEDDDDSDYDAEEEDDDDEDSDADLDSDDEEVVAQAGVNIVNGRRPKRRSKFYKPEEESGVPGSGPGGDFYDRNYDPDNRSKHSRTR